MSSETFAEIARAKINLTLRVLGRRSDGYHELESLVTFAAVGDRIQLRKHVAQGAAADRVVVAGRFANEIVGENLVGTALRLVEEACGRRLSVSVELEKAIPVAAGIGGGSADAAAVLRVLRTAFPDLAASIDWMAIARRLGADVPVCLESRPAWMTGIGERLASAALPRLDVVLVNPCVPVPADKTRRVFEALAAARVGDVPAGGARAARAVPVFADRAALLAHMRGVGNDLERAATLVVPDIADVKAAVAGLPGCDIAVLSGAGPTVVGVFASLAHAVAAEQRLRLERPSWWVRAGTTIAS